MISRKKDCDQQENRTPNLQIWNLTRYQLRQPAVSTPKNKCNKNTLNNSMRKKISLSLSRALGFWTDCQYVLFWYRWLRRCKLPSACSNVAHPSTFRETNRKLCCTSWGFVMTQRLVLKNYDNQELYFNYSKTLLPKLGSSGVFEGNFWHSWFQKKFYRETRDIASSLMFVYIDCPLNR